MCSICGQAVGADGQPLVGTTPGGVEAGPLVAAPDQARLHRGDPRGGWSSVVGPGHPRNRSLGVHRSAAQGKLPAKCRPAAAIRPAIWADRISPPFGPIGTVAAMERVMMTTSARWREWCRRSGSTMTAMVALGAAALSVMPSGLVLMAVAEDVHGHDGIVRRDPGILRWVVDHRPTWLVDLARVVTDTGGVGALAVSAVLAWHRALVRGAWVGVRRVAGRLPRRGRRRRVRRQAALRPRRPPGQLHLVRETGGSLPLGPFRRQHRGAAGHRPDRGDRARSAAGISGRWPSSCPSHSPAPSVRAGWSSASTGRRTFARRLGPRVMAAVTTVTATWLLARDAPQGSGTGRGRVAERWACRRRAGPGRQAASARWAPQRVASAVETPGNVPTPARLGPCDAVSSSRSGQGDMSA